MKDLNGKKFLRFLNAKSRFNPSLVDERPELLGLHRVPELAQDLGKKCNTVTPEYYIHINGQLKLNIMIDTTRDPSYILYYSNH